MDQPASRPDGLGFFDNFSEQSLAELEAAKDRGRPVAGIYCIYAPVEVVRAAGAIPVGLCGKRQAPIQAAEEVLPASICPLIKSSYGYARTDTCPFFAFADFIIAETTCDGKKKMYEFLERIKPVHLMHLPYDQALPGSFEFWRSEVVRLADHLSSRSGLPVTEERLLQEIRSQNTIRELLLDIVRINAAGAPLLTGMELMPVLESKSFIVNTEPYIAALRRLRDELRRWRAEGRERIPGGRPRVLLSGTPVGKGSHKVLALIEESGAVAVCLDNCSGIKGLADSIPESGDPMGDIARRYLDIPCACMTPNPGRLRTIRSHLQEFRADGIVDLTWQCCHGFNIESRRVAEDAEDLGVPFLQIETGYSESDAEQIRTRIEAFLEGLTL
jgi:benzoyl-CoA reductase/2-hydroxyglutaryl-CoA dehydratase subunit BcrC/BadD/HgdB